MDARHLLLRLPGPRVTARPATGNESPGTHGKTNSACFRYSADELPGQSGGRTTTACYSYLGDVPSGDAAQPGPIGKTSTTCFRY
jgi:hypothetical protein